MGRSYNSDHIDDRSLALTLPADRTITERPTVSIETHGCKLNQADSGVLGQKFVRAGFRVVSGEEPVDVYVVNSCTVTHVADRKARHALRSARRRNPEATIVATGCYAQRSPDELKDLEVADIVAGNTDKATLVQSIVAWREEPMVPCAVGDDGQAVSPTTLRTRAMVKIQEGCDQVCAYCIVPRVRGRERSVPPDEIVGEIDRYVALGYKEVVLTGTQLGSYGFDLPGIDLTGLLRRVLAETDVVRLRVSSLQPQELDGDLLKVWEDERVCPHFHIPLQSGSDAVLRRMRRRYTAEAYRHAVDTVLRTVSGASITTDVIAGFPGETSEDFQATYELCEGVGFASMHVFPYSARPGTSAAHFEDQVAAEDRSERARQLVALAKRGAAEFRRRQIGDVRPVLWETTTRADGRELWSGLTDNYIRVMGESPRSVLNTVTLAKLESQSGNRVYARVL
jgi:threonylcarbamoyladenosine tRNA methylthiotransferase MtaB